MVMALASDFMGEKEINNSLMMFWMSQAYFYVTIFFSVFVWVKIEYRTFSPVPSYDVKWHESDQFSLQPMSQHMRFWYLSHQQEVM